MFPTWRMHLREACEALKGGRLDRACQVLADRELSEFRQARELSAQVAARFLQRAAGRLASGESAAGWHDLALAEQLGAGEGTIDQVRQKYATQSLATAEGLLGAGRTSAALGSLERLQRRGLGGERCRELLELAREIVQAERLLAEGEGMEAVAVLAHLGEIPAPKSTRIKGPWNHGASVEIAALQIAERITRLREACHQHQRLSGKLLAAAEAHRWEEVLATSDQMLAIAPRDRVARRARREAWHAVGLDATRAFAPGGASVCDVPLAGAANDSVAPQELCSTMPSDAVSHRFVAWVDEVGGYLVCSDNDVAIGQGGPGAQVAVPVQADLSRRHAVVRREGGAYVLEPLGKTRLDGVLLSGPAVLAGTHQIELGEGVRMKFDKPHALSATARLMMESHHRTEPRVDGVILMADSCVFGPKSHSHVYCRDLPGDLLLVARDGGLWCRSTFPVGIDGVSRESGKLVECGHRIEGERLSLSFEFL